MECAAWIAIYRAIPNPRAGRPRRETKNERKTDMKYADMTIEQQAAVRAQDDIAAARTRELRIQRERAAAENQAIDARRIGSVCACGRKHRTVEKYAAHTWYGYASK